MRTGLRFLVLIVMCAISAPAIAQGVLPIPEAPTSAANFQPNLHEHCQLHGYQSANLVEYSAYGWRCVGFDGAEHDINVDSACEEQFAQPLGGEWSSQARRADDPFSWECLRWCEVTPNAGMFRINYSKPKPSLRLIGPEFMVSNYDEGYDYTVYFKDTVVGPGTNVIAKWFLSGVMMWKIRPSWAAVHPEWRQNRLWRIRYTRPDRTCPYYKYIRAGK